ncbi:hypothetical protein FBR02_17490 [Anaerolineae bacterium CFX9]|nr:hypothetical protein [Anaerolineae bacterium CFX9]
MSSAEYVEKIRQAIMRYRELLDLLQQRTQAAERRYAALFDGLSEADKAALPEKLLQREAALLAIDDMEPLRRAVLQIRFDTREIEKEFEALYDRIADDSEGDE